MPCELHDCPGLLDFQTEAFGTAVCICYECHSLTWCRKRQDGNQRYCCIDCFFMSSDMKLVELPILKDGYCHECTMITKLLVHIKWHEAQPIIQNKIKKARSAQ